MPMTATRVEPHDLEPRMPALTARNSHTQDFMGENVLARMPYFDVTSTLRQLDENVSPLSVTPASITHENGFATRMQLLVRIEGSMASIARRCGFSEGAVRSWRDGQSDISRERCVVMAKTLNVSLIWLITGEGPMRISTTSNDFETPSSEMHATSAATQTIRHLEKSAMRTKGPAVDSRVLAAALRLLQSYVGLLGGSLNPTQRADVLAELYDILRAADEPGHIDRLIAFHTMLGGQMRRGSSLVA